MAFAGALEAALRWRDTLLESARFQRFSASFPPTRRIARREARALFDLCAGFVYSQTLAACVRLKLFDVLAEGPQDAAALAVRLGLPADSAGRLLAAAASLRLAARTRDGRYRLGVLGAALRGNPGVAAMVEHHAMLYADLADPVALLRGEGRPTRLEAFWSYARAAAPADADDAQVAAYSALMAASQQLIAEDILDAYPFGRHRAALDVGGGEGAFLRHVAARAPGLELTLVDLPAVARRARERLDSAGLQKVRAVGCDFLREPLPGGADLVTLIRIVHDHDDDAVVALLANVRNSLAAGGRLLIAEPMASADGAEPVGDAYFGFYLLAMGSGRARRPQELAALLARAGFTGVSARRTRRPMLTGMIVAQP